MSLEIHTRKVPLSSPSLFHLSVRLRDGAHHSMLNTIVDHLAVVASATGANASNAGFTVRVLRRDFAEGR
ncbi:hypothetical protein KC341_g46 [Hortaea werneckii]|nr:hypothetical protein KC341_g46 [Hortaea werneckii]